MNPFKLIVEHEPGHPELLEHSSLDPLLEPAVSRRVFAEARGVQSLPLAAGAQDKEDRIHSLPVRYAWMVAAQRMWFARRYKGQHCLPERIGNAPAVVFYYQAHAESSYSFPPCSRPYRDRL